MTEQQERELELFKRYKGGDRVAKQELLKSLEPVINSQVSKFSASGLPPVAVRMEGKRLTSAALSSYDPEKAQLNTHVINNLKKLNRYVTTYQNIGYIPEPRALMIGKYNVIRDNLNSELGRDPTLTELADAMHVSMAEIERLQSELRSDLSTSIVSEDEDDSGFYEFLNPSQKDYKLQEAIEFVYFDANNIDKKIMEMTLGLHGSSQQKAKDIALALNLSDSELKKRKQAIALQIKELYT